MTTRRMFVALLTIVGAGALGAAALGPSHATRADCPGKIVCSKTGELICRDKCPLVDPNRPDCPGRVECPLTGEPVCRDRCPAESAEAAPACCPGER